MHMNDDDTSEIDCFDSDAVNNLPNVNNTLINKIVNVVRMKTFEDSDRNEQFSIANSSVGHRDIFSTPASSTTVSEIDISSDNCEYVIDDNCDTKSINQCNQDMQEQTGTEENSDDVNLSVIKYSDIMHKYKMSFESDNGVYITGATILAMKGVISLEEYYSNDIKSDIPSEILEKKFYIEDAAGAMRRLDRLLLADYNNRAPAAKKLKRIVEENVRIIEKTSDIIYYTDDSDNEGLSDDQLDCLKTGEVSDNASSDSIESSEEINEGEEYTDSESGESRSVYIPETPYSTVISESESEDKENELPEERCKGVKRKRNQPSQRMKKSCLFSSPSFIDTHFF